MKEKEANNPTYLQPVNKKIVYGILLYAALVIFAFYGYVALARGKYAIWFWPLLLILIGIGKYGMPKISEEHPKEYTEAERIAFSQRSSPKSYLLASVLVILIVVLLYVFIVR